MDTAITLSNIVSMFGIVVAVVAGMTAIFKVIAFFNEQHDKLQKYDDYQTQLDQLMSEQYILTKSMLAVLEGLKQQGCNGPVTQAKDELELYLNQKAHKA